MTYREKLKKDTGLDVNGAGCPCDHGYEERRGFYTHCASMSCDDCWDREIETECVDGTEESVAVDRLLK